MEPQKTTTAEVVKEVPGKTVISFNRPTPLWATQIFRAVFILTTAAQMWIGSTGLIKSEHKPEIMNGLSIFTFVVWGVGKGLGVKKEDFESNQ